jgi:hypothetical protein
VKKIRAAKDEKTYLSISTGLRNAEPIVFGAAPTFFGVMSDGGFVMAQMCLARLYGTTACLYRNSIGPIRFLGESSAAARRSTVNTFL